MTHTYVLFVRNPHGMQCVSYRLSSNTSHEAGINNHHRDLHQVVACHCFFPRCSVARQAREIDDVQGMSQAPKPGIGQLVQLHSFSLHERITVWGRLGWVYTA